MERYRAPQELAQEEMYFEMDFTSSDDIMEDLDDASILSDTQEDMTMSQDLELLHNYSHSIPIQSTSPISHSIPKSPGPAHKSEPRTFSPPCLVSHSRVGTPSSSVSPSSSLIPRILRESFSKFLNRGSGQRAKTPEKDPTCSDSECYKDERRASECSTISPATEEVVTESLRNGLPIIPFAYPSFFTMGRYQEDIKKRIRKNSQISMKRSFSEGRCIDYSEVFEEDDESIKKCVSEDKSLDSIVKIAKQEMQSANEGKTDQQSPRKESQSSYVEMNPEEIFTKDDPYMKMENFLEDDYLHMEKRKQAEDRLSHIDTNNHHSRVNFDYLFKKPPKRKHNLFHLGRHKGELQMHENMGRHFKKGNKHKDDYVYFDCEKNKDYMDMGKTAKTKKWHFLDFKTNK